ncbi:O-antigen ligase family protein [Candidatus Berkelbacteria bacterium]|nr:O-antigen ligase family protein [Candidatus Berkelbacteria bacterium]
MKTIKKFLAYSPLLFPTYLVRFDLGPIPTNLLEVLIGILLLIVVFNLLINTKLRQEFWQNLSPHKTPLILVTLIIIAATISTAIVAPEVAGIDGPVAAQRIALGIWKGWLVIPIAYFITLLGLNLGQRWQNQTLQALSVSGVLLSLWAIAQSLTGQLSTIDGRASGPFESANYLALYIAPILVGTIALTGQSLKTKAFWPWLLASLVMATGLVLSLSYGAFVGVFAGLAVWLILKKDTLKQNLWPYLGLLAVAAILIISQAGTDKLGQLFDPSAGGSTSVRLEIYQVAIAMIKSNPILGLGLGQFDIQYPLQVGEIIGRHPLEWTVLHPHNFFLATWLNGGLLMLVSFLGLIAWGVKLALAKPTLTKKIALAILATILIHGLFDTPYWKNDLAYLWWLTFALML